ncbi:MAG: hydrogenase [Armatimonadetes bacterium]|nr:hydrogenase [Armatimonadota bacterium]
MKNPYLPHVAVIQDIRDEGPGLKSFDLAFRDGSVWEEFRPQPGQFVELSVFGEGEAPFGVATGAHETGLLRLSIQQVGRLTKMLHSMAPGDEVGVRGPFGNGWPLEAAKGKNLILIGGGIGMPPVRSALVSAMAEKDQYESISLFYGARSPEHITYADEIEQWIASDDAKINVTVDVGDDTWPGHVGVITTLLEDEHASPANAVTMTCGPPIMIHFVIPTLTKLGFSDDQIIVSLEARMKCGIGKCGRCNLGAEYICLDGPVFSYDHLQTMGIRL